MNIGKFCPLPLSQRTLIGKFRIYIYFCICACLCICILFLLSLSYATGTATTGSNSSQLRALTRHSPEERAQPPQPLLCRNSSCQWSENLPLIAENIWFHERHIKLQPELPLTGMPGLERIFFGARQIFPAYTQSLSVWCS